MEVPGAVYASHPGSPGVALPSGGREERHVQDTAVGLCRASFGNSFPGSQPVSLDRSNLREIAKAPKNYWVAEKSDGTRFLMLINKEGAYLVDRSFRVRKLNLHFPFPAHKTSAQTPPVLDKTLLDGEMVIDHVDNVYILNYLVYDTISWMGENVMRLSLDQRLKCAQNDVLWPRKLDKMYDYSKEPINVKLKEFMALKNLPYLFDHVIPNLKHENDGLIFTPVKLPYIPGTCRQLLKWKPGSLNSVDFELKVEWRARKRGYSLLAAERLAKRFYAWITFSPEERTMFDNDRMASGKILECVWDPEWHTWIPAVGADTWEAGEWQKGGWRYMRVREDKKLANDISVIEKIQRSRADDIKQTELLELLAQEGSSSTSSSSSSSSTATHQHRPVPSSAAAHHHGQRPTHSRSGASQGTPEQSPESSPLSSPVAPARTAPPLKRDRSEERSGEEEADGVDGANDSETASSSAKKQRIDFLLTGSSSASSSSTADNDSHVADPYANFNFPGRE